MPRHAPELECSAEDKASLVAITKGRIEEARTVERARIILACVDGKEIQQVARELGVSVPTVTKWRRRFALWGLRGLGDQSRSGKPVKYDTAFRNRVLALLEETPPPGMSHWDGPAVAERLGSSVYAVWRVLRREGIYLQRRRSWCVSTDKEFAPKAADVVGLYLNPPLNAVVLSVDEKPSIQAIERASGYVETDSGKVVRGLKSTYKRHGTLNLFAALEVGTGQVKTKFTEFKKREDFRGFLDGVLAEQPQDAEIHVIAAGERGEEIALVGRGDHGEKRHAVFHGALKGMIWPRSGITFARRSPVSESEPQGNAARRGASGPVDRAED